MSALFNIDNIAMCKTCTRDTATATTAAPTPMATMMAITTTILRSLPIAAAPIFIIVVFNTVDLMRDVQSVLTKLELMDMAAELFQGGRIHLVICTKITYLSITTGAMVKLGDDFSLFGNIFLFISLLYVVGDSVVYTTGLFLDSLPYYLSRFGSGLLYPVGCMHARNLIF